MTFRITFLILIASSCSLPNTNQQELFKGMVITESTLVVNNHYSLAGEPDLDSPVITIQGEDITVDFNDAILQGNNQIDRPDKFSGLAVLVKGGKNITLKNLKAKGYKVALIARDVDNLILSNCDFSYNYRKHLNSTQEKEDLSDWMSYHHNENNEWLRYGAAIYLDNCNNASVVNNRVTGGQNALLMTNCNYGKIMNNDFSFNSSIGIAMYRSSFNSIAHNKLNFNVRGYSHGVYNRGQDSAGILVYEQSNNNVFFKNAATHSGDGFFLWAGQHTMDTGEGGCNDNLIIGNDFSYAPTNGIEITFSKNCVTGNTIYGCDHGIWGGYSFDSEIVGNKFKDNRIDIAIEHGQNNKIFNNKFTNAQQAIKLWSREKQPSGWGYSKNRDTRSMNYIIAENTFTNSGVPFDITKSDNLTIAENKYINTKTSTFAKTVTNLKNAITDHSELKVSIDTLQHDLNKENTLNPLEGKEQLAGRSNILITEWGPYDYRYPIIWNTNPVDQTGKMNFDILGPAGKWKVINYRGLRNITAKAGEIPGSLSAESIQESGVDIFIELEFVGEAFIDQFGNTIESNTPFKFHYSKFFQPIDFTISWFPFDSLNNPLQTGRLFPENVRVRPIKSEKTNKLDFAIWGGLKGTKTYKQFLTVAEGLAELTEGSYKLGITWDDAVRVYVDDELVIDEWKPLANDYDEAPHKNIELNFSSGKHHFRAEHVALGGVAALSLKLTKVESSQ